VLSFKIGDDAEASPDEPPIWVKQHHMPEPMRGQSERI
jgi:hypothetical protein